MNTLSINTAFHGKSEFTAHMAVMQAALKGLDVMLIVATAAQAAALYIRIQRITYLTEQTLGIPLLVSITVKPDGVRIRPGTREEQEDE